MLEEKKAFRRSHPQSMRSAFGRSADVVVVAAVEVVYCCCEGIYAVVRRVVSGPWLMPPGGNSPARNLQDAASKPVLLLT